MCLALINMFGIIFMCLALYLCVRRYISKIQLSFSKT